MTSVKKRIASSLTATIFAATLAVSATAAEVPDESIRVSSYKGSTLEAEERSGLIIGPSGADYTVTSSNPDSMAVNQVLTFWVAVAKAEGRAEGQAAVDAGYPYGFGSNLTVFTGTADAAQRAANSSTPDNPVEIVIHVNMTSTTSTPSKRRSWAPGTIICSRTTSSKKRSVCMRISLRTSARCFSPESKGVFSPQPSLTARRAN